MGCSLAAITLSSPQPIVGDLIESLVSWNFGVLAVVGLLGSLDHCVSGPMQSCQKSISLCSLRAVEIW